VTRITLTVNGTAKTIDVEPRRLLADVLRDEFGCCGVHLGCSHGVCGCCTVHVEGEARLSCITFAVQCDGMNVVTIEGLGTAEQMHPLQQAFIDEHGLQCGFCTPGMIMALAPLVERDEVPTDAEIREAISGNLCRCTGYDGIVAAVKTCIAGRRVAANG
jgi:carbon-monoxide dehydrogenase small subunit